MNAIKTNLIERVFWLIRLRWIAVGGVGAVTFFTTACLRLQLPVVILYSIAVFIAAYNLLFYIYLKRLVFAKTDDSSRIINCVANAQISLDLLCLVALLHFSGGIENPFIFYFIFHMIIAGILLSKQASFRQAALAVSLFSLEVVGEYFGLVPHHSLTGFISEHLYNNPVYVCGVLFVFISTIYIAVYMATSISQRLRLRERSLEEANALLNEKDRVKSEYVMRVSHDIKEHLAAIQGCIEPVTAGITGPLNPQQENLLKRAAERTEKLLFFVKALLELTRIKLSREIPLQVFSLREMLADITKNISSPAKNKNITLTAGIDAGIDRINGIKEYLQETLMNILVNAIKYTPERGEVGIFVSAKNNDLFIRVKDSGIGIPKEEQAKIFEEFYRASNARMLEKDGTGLGLSIARQVVEMHQGRIWVESEEGRGSVFYITLPVLTDNKPL